MLTITTLLPGGDRTATLQISPGLSRDDFRFLSEWILFQGSAFPSLALDDDAGEPQIEGVKP